MGKITHQLYWRFRSLSSIYNLQECVQRQDGSWVGLVCVPQPDCDRELGGGQGEHSRLGLHGIASSTGKARLHNQVKCL